MNFLSRHESPVLAFSGGKDSLATLFTLREHWNRLRLLWVNTGDSFPETKALVYSFGIPVIEAKSDQPGDIKNYGPPSDVIDAWDTPFGRSLEVGRKFRVQTPFDCCSKNLWQPAHWLVKQMGITGVIRGQRESEGKKAPFRSGFIEDGVEYWFPIEDWSDEEVNDFLAAEGVPIPANYAYFNSSADCMRCTAYLTDNQGKGRYLKENFPQAFADRQRRLRYIALSLESDHKLLLAEAE